MKSCQPLPAAEEDAANHHEKLQHQTGQAYGPDD